MFITPSKILGQFLVCSQISTETKLFASSLLCCSIFTLVLIGRPTIQCVTTFYKLLCNSIKKGLRNKNFTNEQNISPDPASILFRQTASGSTVIFLRLSELNRASTSVHFSSVRSPSTGLYRVNLKNVPTRKLRYLRNA